MPNFTKFDSVIVDVNLRETGFSPRVRKLDLEEMVSEAQQGNEEAFAELYIRFRGLVMAHVQKSHLKIMREEALSEGLMALVEAIHTYDFAKKVRFAGYADACIRYRLWNLFKREKRRWQREVSYVVPQEEEAAAIEPPDPRVNVEKEVLDRLYLQEMLPELNTAITLLPERQRYVILRHVVGQESLTQIAEELGIKVQAVWNLKKRALARLKNVTSGMYIDERR